MLQERVEEYLGAIYRLRGSAATPLPLSELTEYFGFSPVSIHEMIQKLDERGWVSYQAYRGVTLTADGEEVAQALLRRHRLWERFLTDILGIPWDEAHEIAGRLEHASTEVVTERLAVFLGEPDACPHGGPIPPAAPDGLDACLTSVPVGALAKVVRIAPETPEVLHRAKALGLLPGAELRVVAKTDAALELALAAEDGEVRLAVPEAESRAVWVEVV